MISHLVSALLISYGTSSRKLMQVPPATVTTFPVATIIPEMTMIPKVTVIPEVTVIPNVPIVPTDPALQTTAPAVGTVQTTAAVAVTTTAAPVVPATTVPVAVPSQTTSVPAPTTPTTAAPVTAAPITAAPVTAAPVTAAPVTAAPVTTTMAPVAPAGYQWGAHGQLCPITLSSTFTKCLLTTDIHTDVGREGYIDCNAYDADCCMCALIECGHNALDVPCHTVNIGSSGAYGTVMHVRGDPIGIGALINCQGVEGCRFTTIEASSVYALDCNGDKSCEGATVHIVDPKPGFLLDCSGMGSCTGLKVDIEFTGPPAGYMCRPVDRKRRFPMSGIQCNNAEACQGMELSIHNAGCDKVRIENINCLQSNSCNLASFELVGDIEIANCQCGPSCNTASGLSKCFQNLDRLLCPDPASCMGQTKTITNTLNNFKFECGNVQSCELAQFTFEYNQDSSRPRPVELLEAFVFGGQFSARGSTFTFVNEQGVDPFTQIPIILTIGRIECGGAGSCQGTTFVTGSNVEVNEVICATDSCLGCVIKLNANDVGRPCDPNQVPAVPVIEVPTPPLTPITQAPVVTTQAPQTPQPTPSPTNSMYVPIGNNGNGQWVPIR